MEIVIGVGRTHSQNYKTLSPGVKGYALPWGNLSAILSRECGENWTEAFSTCYPGPQASGQVGETGAQESLRTVSHRAAEPSPWVPIGQVQASK